ncbi:MAG TPA: DUF927 domain-containing protein [Bryobacteraceae bacterium]|nr:DUF927 domain-containing protein [Bryobacteraceae bacterium]
MTNRKETYNDVPQVLKNDLNWLVRKGKVPYDAKTGKPASSTNSETWADFDTALHALQSDSSYDGLGFAINKPYVFVDLDHCVADDGEIEQWADEIVSTLNSYTEASPSGTGLHILCTSQSDLPPTGRKKGRIEIYSGQRYFTVTGNHIPGTPDTIEDRTEELLELHQEVFGTSIQEPAHDVTEISPSPGSCGTDEAIIAACRNAKNAEKFVKLFDHGETSAHDNNHSVADAALCAVLAYRTRDREQIDRIFRNSALMRPKWDEKRGDRTYGQRTVEHAIKIQKSVPPGFSVSDNGVYFQPPPADDGEVKPPIHLSSKIEIVAATRNTEGGEWGRLLKWHDLEERLHIWAMPMSMLAGDGNEILAELLAGGMIVAPNRKARELFKNYLQEANPPVFMKSVSRVGWHDDCYVFPDSTVGGIEDGEEVVFQSFGVEHQFTVSGSLEDWKQHVALPCAGNSRLVFGVATAFAAPLLQLIDGESGGFQFVGPSSTGKSTALRVAASVYGGKNYVRSWRSTANGLEGVASLHNDALLVLDEMGQANPKEVGEVTYMLANGQGKVRMLRSGGTRKALQWRLLFLSSGEVGLRDHMMSIGGKVRGGQEVRCVDIDADAGMKLGLFEKIPGHTDAGSFADSLTKAAHRYHGVAGRTFISQIAEQRDDIRKLIIKEIDRFIREHSQKHALKDASGEVYRALSRFALVAAAGELATELDITGWGKGEAEQAASACFKAWLTRRGGKGVRDVDAGIRQVKAFLERHGSSRFQLKKNPYNEGGTPAVSNRAGFRESKGNECIYYVLPEAFQDEVCAGYDHRLIAKELVKLGYLEHDQGRNTKKVRLPDVGMVNAYMILPSLLSEPDAAKNPALPICDLFEIDREQREQREHLM